MSLSKQLKIFNKAMMSKHIALKKAGVNVLTISEEELLNRIADLLMNVENEPDWMVTLALYAFASSKSEFAPAQLIAQHMASAASDVDDAIALPDDEVLK